MKATRIPAIAAACLAIAGCTAGVEPIATTEEAPKSVLEVDATPRIKPQHGGRLITLARIEGGVDYVTRKPWMRVVKNESAASLAAKSGVGLNTQALTPTGYCGIADAMVGGYGATAPIEFYDGASDPMTTNDDGDLNDVGTVTMASTCITRSGHTLEGSEMALFNTDGIGCLQFVIKNKSAVTFSEVFVDVDTYNGTVDDHTPYLHPIGPVGTVDDGYLDARHAPSEAHGLWTFGDVAAGTVLAPTTEKVWGFFREKLDSPFNWKGSLVVEVAEICGNNIDEDCDTIADNGCGEQNEGDTCYTDADCDPVSNLVCVGTNLSKKFGKGPGNADQSGTCGVKFPDATIASGHDHTCAIVDDGDVKCWGGNSLLDTGLGSMTPQPNAQIAPNLSLGSAPAVALFAGLGASCAIFDDATMRCWGKNDSAQSNGIPASGDVLAAAASPLAVGGNVRQISMGTTHTCALRDDGGIRCFGSNGNGECGQGNNAFNPLSLASSADVNLPGPALQVCGGNGHTCALVKEISGDQNVYCWGDNNLGRLGLGPVASSQMRVGDNEAVDAFGAIQILSAADIAADRYVRNITCGVYHTCAVLNSGDMRCWGLNMSGELGLGTSGSSTQVGDDELPSSKPFVNVGSGRAIMQVTAGYSTTCALLDDKSVKCWGANYGAGCLGYGGTCSTHITAPRSQDIDLRVANDVNAVELAAHSGSDTLCVRFSNGGVKCWGENPNNACGYDLTSTPKIDPVRMDYTLAPDPICGNSMMELGETCDDGNTTTEECSYGLTSCTVCNATCQSVAGATAFCGDSTTQTGETCDDGNTTTEACTYGSMSCTVCNSTCQSDAGATAFCGDSITNFANGEECDGGANCDAACLNSCVMNADCSAHAICNVSNECQCDAEYSGTGYPSMGGCTRTFKGVFVTNSAWRGDSVGSAANADGFCQTSASAASLGGTWKAWISDSTSSPSTRFSQSGPYRMLDGTLVATSWADLIDGTIANNIDTTETLVANISWPVWTATTTSGTYEGGSNCQDWTSTNDGDGWNGFSNDPNGGWTHSGQTICSNFARLYCFEQ